MQNGGAHTWDDIACVHVVLVLDEPEAVHELDLGNLAGAMGVEVVLNIGLGSYNHTIRLAMPCPGLETPVQLHILETGAEANPSQSKK